MNVQCFGLEGKVAVVTGAASVKGIGRSIALLLATAGAEVVICDQNTKGQGYDLDGTAKEIQRLGRRCLSIRIDVSNSSDVNNLIVRAVEEFGTVDILINNAGILGLTSFLDDKGKVWDKVIDINLKGCYLCSQAASRVMVKQKSGSIINIASSAGMKWAPDSCIYGISKAGVIQLTRWLGRELGQYNVRVNAIAPGPVDTNIERHSVQDDSLPAAPKKTMTWKDQVPLGRIGEPGDIAPVALFLASDASRFITGQIVIVDGGLSL